MKVTPTPPALLVPPPPSRLPAVGSTSLSAFPRGIGLSREARGRGRPHRSLPPPVSPGEGELAAPVVPCPPGDPEMETAPSPPRCVGWNGSRGSRISQEVR